MVLGEMNKKHHLNDKQTQLRVMYQNLVISHIKPQFRRIVLAVV